MVCLESRYSGKLNTIAAISSCVKASNMGLSLPSYFPHCAFVLLSLLRVVRSLPWDGSGDDTFCGRTQMLPQKLCFDSPSLYTVQRTTLFGTVLNLSLKNGVLTPPLRLQRGGWGVRFSADPPKVSSRKLYTERGPGVFQG